MVGYFHQLVFTLPNGQGNAFIKTLRWIPAACWGEGSGDSPPVNRFVVCAGHMSYVRNRRRNVGHRSRRYITRDAASQPVCLAREQGRQVCNALYESSIQPISRNMRIGRA